MSMIDLSKALAELLAYHSEACLDQLEMAIQVMVISTNRQANNIPLEDYDAGLADGLSQWDIIPLPGTILSRCLSIADHASIISWCR